MNNSITTFVHSRPFEVLAGIGVVTATLVAYAFGLVEPVEGSRGILFPSPNLWITSPGLSLTANIFAMLVIALACNELNKSYNIMRAQTALWGTLYLVMQGALPSIAGQFYGGTLLALVIVASAAILFSCFGERGHTQRIFIVFFMITVEALFQYAALFFIPILFVALLQMRILTLRSVLAALLGIITPGFVLFGCGFVTWADVSVPHFQGTLAALTASEMVLTFSAVGLSIMLGLTAMSFNLIKTLSYTAKFRAFNGFFTFVMFAVIILLLIDYRNLATYLPLLFFTLAYQTAHAFSNYRTPRSFIVILGIILTYAAIYALTYALF